MGSGFETAEAFTCLPLPRFMARIRGTRMKRLDLTGQTFGWLTTIEIDHTTHGMPYWRCRCICGNETIVARTHLRSGNTVSCGCYCKKVLAHKIPDDERFASVESRPLRSTWATMRSRCNNPNATGFRFYGARGIRCCPEWDSYDIFYDWAMSHGWKEGLTLDRIDFNGDYCPENCRWVSRKEQANNTRANHWIEYNGVKHNIKQWSELTGIPTSSIQYRLKQGYPLDIVFSKEKIYKLHWDNWKNQR